jgi:hypothetical protein
MRFSTSETPVEVVLSVVLLVEVVHDGRKNRRLDLSHLRGRVLLPKDLVEPAETAAKSRVEVIFDIVVGSG